jgi:glyoxylase I family protein
VPFPAIAHVAVTVSDLAASVAWYSRLFGSDPVLDEDEESGTFHHAVFLLDGGMLFGLHTHVGGDAAAPFRETDIGLDHVAFGCAPDDLARWEAHLNDLGIAHGGRKDAHYGSGISFRDPDGIALEFFAPAQ